MLSLTKSFFKLTENIEVFISLVFINIFLLYFNFVTNEQVLILTNALIVLIIIFSSSIINSLEILLKTNVGDGIKERINKSNVAYLPYIANIVLFIAIIALIILLAQFMTYLPLIVYLAIFIIELVLNLSIFKLNNNILQVLIRTFTYACFIPLMISFSQVPNLVSISSSMITFNFKIILDILIVTLPIFILFINMSLSNLIDNSSNKMILNKRNTIFEVSYFILVFSVIPAIIYNIFPLSFVVLLVIGYIINSIIIKRKVNNYFQWQCIIYSISILTFAIITI